MKTALITGGSGGIGAACVKAFLDAGYEVTFSYFSNEPKSACDAHSFKCDVADPNGIKELFSYARKEMGHIDVLVNCAGIAQSALFDTISDEDYRRMMAVNTDGVFFSCREAIPEMVSRKSGRIINISSMWGSLGASMEVHYSASKGAVNALTKALSKELAPCSVTVNAIAPGAIDTKMLSGYSAEDLRLLCADIPLGRLGKPEEVAALAVFLSGSDAAYITGQIIGVDGGMT